MNQSVGFLYMGHLQVRKGNVIVSVMKGSNVAQLQDYCIVSDGYGGMNCCYNHYTFSSWKSCRWVI